MAIVNQFELPISIKKATKNLPISRKHLNIYNIKIKKTLPKRQAKFSGGILIIMERLHLAHSICDLFVRKKNRMERIVRSSNNCFIN